MEHEIKYINNLPLCDLKNRAELEDLKNIFEEMIQDGIIYDDTELRELIANLSNQIDELEKDSCIPYDDTEVKRLISELREELESIDCETGSYDDTDIKNQINELKNRLDNFSPSMGDGEQIKSIKEFGAKCDGVTDDTLSFESALSSDTSIIKIPKGITLIRQGQSYISYGVKKKVVGEEGAIIKCDFDSCKHFLNLAINIEFENITFDFNNKNILNAITYSKNVGLIRMKNLTFQNVNDTDSNKSTDIIKIFDGEVNIDNIRFKNMKKRGNGSISDGGGNLTCLSYFPLTEKKGYIKNVTITETHNVNASGQIIFEDVSGIYVNSEAPNKDVLIIENISGNNFGKRLIKLQASNIHVKNIYGYSNIADSLSVIGVLDTTAQGNTEINHGNVTVENFNCIGKIQSPIATSCRDVIFRNGFIDTEYCDMNGNTGGSRAFSFNGRGIIFENVIASTNIIGFIENNLIESVKNVSGKNVKISNCSFTVKESNQVYGIISSYGKQVALEDITLNNITITSKSSKMNIMDFTRGTFKNINLDNINIIMDNSSASYSPDGILISNGSDININNVKFSSNSINGIYDGIKITESNNVTLTNVSTIQNDPKQNCKLLNILNSNNVYVASVRNGNCKYLTFNNCTGVLLLGVDRTRVLNTNSSTQIISTTNL